MGSVTLTGKDTVILKGRIFSAFGDGDTATLEFPNNLVEGKVGKNGNVVFAFNASGQVANVKLRLLLASDDDKFLNSEVQSFLQDPAAYTVLDGEFIKRTGDGKGGVANTVYMFSAGVIQKIPAGKENTSGETEQAYAEYTLLFANTQRAIV